MLVNELVKSNELDLNKVKFIKFNNIYFNKNLNDKINHHNFINILIDKLNVSATQIVLYYDEHLEDNNILVSFLFILGFINKVIIGTSEECFNSYFKKYAFRYCKRFNYKLLLPEICNDEYNEELRRYNSSKSWYKCLFWKFVKSNKIYNAQDIVLKKIL